MLGRPSFFDPSLSHHLTYLGSEWRSSALVKADIPVRRLLQGASGYSEPRLAHLASLLNLPLDSSMHVLSDGQRQSVQIAASLMKDFKVLLMDETTVECDVLVRRNLLRYLKEKTETENATILYATHVFDGMASWPTHLMHVAGGKVSLHLLKDCEEYQSMLSDWNPTKDSPLSALIERWLERDWEEKVKRDAENKGKPKALTMEQRLANDRRFGDKYYDYSH